MFACFNAQCRIWTSQLNAYADGWHHLGFNGEPPTWEFGDPEIAPDRSYVSLPLGNSFTYGHAKLFLDTFPENLYSHFPLDFRADLECRVSPDADWTSVVDWNATHDKNFFDWQNYLMTHQRNGRITWFLRKGRSHLEDRSAINVENLDNIFLRWRRRHTLARWSSRDLLV